MLERLAPGRLLALVGGSGSGKSSVLRAGVVAAACVGEVAGDRVPLLTTPASDGLVQAGGLVVPKNVCHTGFPEVSVARS